MRWAKASTGRGVISAAKSQPSPARDNTALLGFARECDSRIVAPLVIQYDANVPLELKSTALAAARGGTLRWRSQTTDG
jgi:hypothetical protein